MDTLVYAPSISLDDKYLVEGHQVFITGVQALVRLPLLRREADAQDGLNTAGFISGYRGSPLGTYDKQLWHERQRLSDHHIIFRPAVNEELAATAVWGTQQAGSVPRRALRRRLRHLVRQSARASTARATLSSIAQPCSARRSMAACWSSAGDDHACKSSTLPNQSDYAFIDAEIPVLELRPISQEFIEFGM